jgi:hypothetical protein
LVFYASISCGAAYLARLNLPFHFPIMLLRLGVLGYCGYIIAIAEGNKELAILLGGAMLIGCIGGYWDLIEVHTKYVSPEMTLTLTATSLAVLITISYVLNQSKADALVSKK